jgi:nicotinamide riboside kinase
LLHQREIDLTLLTGLDLHPANAPFTHAEQNQRMHMDQTLRAALSQHAQPFALVYGTGAARCANALQAIRFHLREPAALKTAPSRWRWPCEKCSDPACEHRLFSALLA